MKTAILAALIASPVLAAQPLSVEVRTRVDDVDAKDLAERISDVASRTIPWERSMRTISQRSWSSVETIPPSIVLMWCA